MVEVPAAPLVGVILLSTLQQIYSDASGSWGCGARIGWFQVPWPADWQSVVKELVPSGAFCFHSDNMAVVTPLLRCIALFSGS